MNILTIYICETEYIFDNVKNCEREQSWMNETFFSEHSMNK